MQNHRKKLDSLLKQQQDILKKQQSISDELEATKKQHNAEIYKVFDRLPIHSIDADVLIGGLQYVCIEAAKKSPTVESWRLAGRKFCGKRVAQKNKPILKQGAKADATIQSL